MITKADVVTKTSIRTTALPEANVFSAADVNEFKRVTDNIVDYVEGLGRLPVAYGGLYICEGVGTQTINSEETITINQWTNTQPAAIFTIVDGDQSLTIPVGGAGRYRISIEHFDYGTTAKNREVYRFRLQKNGANIPGLCSRVEHAQATDSTYHTTIGRIVDLAEGDVITMTVTSGVLAAPRTIDVRHASIIAQRIGEAT